MSSIRQRTGVLRVNSEFNHTCPTNHASAADVQKLNFTPDDLHRMKRTLHLTAIHLRVADLSRSVEFYSSRLGFTVARKSATEAKWVLMSALALSTCGRRL